MYKRISLLLLNLHTHPVVVLKTIWSTSLQRAKWVMMSRCSQALCSAVRRLKLQKTPLWNSLSNVYNFGAFPITSLVFENSCRVNQTKINKRLRLVNLSHMWATWMTCIHTKTMKKACRHCIWSVYGTKMFLSRNTEKSAENVLSRRHKQFNLDGGEQKSNVMMWWIRHTGCLGITYIVIGSKLQKLLLYSRNITLVCLPQQASHLRTGKQL